MASKSGNPFYVYKALQKSMIVAIAAIDSGVAKTVQAVQSSSQPKKPATSEVKMVKLTVPPFGTSSHPPELPAEPPRKLNDAVLAWNTLWHEIKPHVEGGTIENVRLMFIKGIHTVDINIRNTGMPFLLSFKKDGPLVKITIKRRCDDAAINSSKLKKGDDTQSEMFAKLFFEHIIMKIDPSFHF